MSAVPLVILAAALSLGVQPPPSPQPKPTPSPGPKPAPQVNVLIVLDTRDKLQDLCKAGNVVPTTILVTRKTTGKEKEKEKPAGNVVFHCIDSKLIPHSEHGMNPALEKADVHLATGQRVRWYMAPSNGRFFVVRVEKPKQDLKNSNPASPFPKPFAATYASEVISLPVVDVPKVSVTQRYKVTFNIEGEGEVDPDLVCSM